MRAILMCRGFYPRSGLGRLQGSPPKTSDLAEHPVWPPAVLLFPRVHVRAAGPVGHGRWPTSKKLMDIVEVSRPDFFLRLGGLRLSVASIFARPWWRGLSPAKGDLEHALADSDEAVRFAPLSGRGPASSRFQGPRQACPESPTSPTPTAAQPQNSSRTRSSPYPIRDHRAPSAKHR